MNIIAGIARGVKLDVHKGLGVRPTGVMARKSLFDSLRTFDNFVVVDLFAGTGALGLEAASRCAAEVYFVENSKSNCKIISNNITKVKRAGVFTDMLVVCSDVGEASHRLEDLSGKIDIIFADPPYDEAASFADKIFADRKFASWAGQSLFIFETPFEGSRRPDFEKNSLWNVKNRRKLGQSVFYFLRVGE